MLQSKSLSPAGRGGQCCRHSASHADAWPCVPIQVKQQTVTHLSAELHTATGQMPGPLL